uniref:thioredoxin domain-containing protein n=1 Tax=uncultured Draconibacterium sp. TaxID=1573823 RepID=UPI00321652AD
MKYTNKLIQSTSPYLLQHAHNPVNWNQWSEEVLKQAQKENKLILVSIGYAACHWCHVMEHESFEDTEVARVMNENYVCIKVDREERPDVDHYYMSAVQLMGLQGGWPLNVIALPDGRPIWGGTYFPKEAWSKNLLTVAEFFKNNESKTAEYGNQLKERIKQVSLPEQVQNEVPVTEELIKAGVEGWKQRWDMKEGGSTGSPKFPMPVNLDFLLYYGFIKNDNKTLEFVHTTLEKMAYGGIYDQVGGGFARYSVDEKWKVPHFEKMLYDNAQLLSSYSKGYQYYKNEEFKRVVYETICFMERELMNKTGAFYSSLDADSEGEEGKFYVWKEQELKPILGTNYPLFANYYNVNKKGFWEKGNNILLRNIRDENFAAKNNLTLHQLQVKIGKWKYVLLKERKKRVRPGLDDKTLTSWNALAIQGLVDACKAFNEEHFLRLAIKSATFISGNLLNENGKLFHSWKAGISSIDGFLEDYAFVIQAYISLFEVTGDKTWLNLAEKINAFTLKHFYDENSGLFYFSEKNSVSVIGNHFQKEDNVIPAANSVMANNLHRLYLLFGRPEYQKMAKKMLQYITPYFNKYPMAYANWGALMLKQTEPYFEVAVCGINSNILLSQLQVGYQPNILWAHTNSESEIPILKSRFQIGDDLIYVCRDGVCQLPVKTAEEALNLLKEN